MNSHDYDHDDGNDDRHDSESSPSPPRSTGTSPSRSAVEPQSIDTDDPVVVSGPPQGSQWKQHPDSTMVIQTSRIREPDDAPAPSVVMVPVEYGQKPSRGAQPRDDGDDDRDPPANPPSMTKILLFAGLVALVCGMAGAWGMSYFMGPSKSDDQQASSPNPSKSQSKSSGSKSKDQSGSNSGSGAENAQEIPGFTRADDAATLRKQNEQLAERIDRLSERIDGLSRPRNETSAGVRTLQIKVGNLARTVEDMGDMTSRFRRLEDRLEDVSQQVKTLRSQIPDSGVVPATRPTSMVVPNLAPQTLPSSETPFDLMDSADASLMEGIKLFHEGRYPEAENIFRKLQLTRSWDARVWYFSALSHGLLTGDWGGETRRLVSRGIDREKVGQPPSKSIDASLSGLTRSQGKDWLASLRVPAVAKR
jgi:hypothetical protein